MFVFFCGTIAQGQPHRRFLGRSLRFAEAALGQPLEGKPSGLCSLAEAAPSQVQQVGSDTVPGVSGGLSVPGPQWKSQRRQSLHSVLRSHADSPLPLFSVSGTAGMGSPTPGLRSRHLLRGCDGLKPMLTLQTETLRSTSHAYAGNRFCYHAYAGNRSAITVNVRVNTTAAEGSAEYIYFGCKAS